MMKAGVVAALALTLLVPTFNALNLSYVENVTPPPWLTTPEDPPNITPPTDFEPPPDFEPPEGYEGEIPPGACPPPVVRELNETRQAFSVQGPQPAWTQRIPFTVPQGALALEGYVNFTSWQARSIAVRLDGPEGFQAWTEGDQGEGSGLLVQPTAQRTSFHYKSYEGDEPSPVPEGEYLLTLSAEFPIDGEGDTRFGVALACGGMMSG
jgi:hypothetical protein